MTVSSQCVRISLFQCAPHSDAGVHQAHQASQVDGKRTAKQHLFRSRSADYRGDVLIPLASIASLPRQSVDKTPVNVTLPQLRDGLEGRLSAFCVLHLPASRTRRFVEEHRLTPSSLSLSPPAAESSAPKNMRLPSCADEQQGRDSCGGEPSHLSDNAKFRCCASCSSTVLAEAATVSSKVPASLSSLSAPAGVASTVTSTAPWICINQLQRMTAPRSGTTLQTPSLLSRPQAPSVPRASPQPMLSAEEWMRQQRHSSDVFLTSSEVESIGVVAVEDDGAGSEVEGGVGYAAFFSLTMLPAAERAKRLRRSLAPSSGPAAAAPVLRSPAVFMVRAHHHTLRMGLPLPALDKDGTPKAPSSSPTLREVIIDRLRLQRGVHVERLLDAESGAAVLPCEGAAMLLSAQVGSLEAECRVPSAAQNEEEGGWTQRLAPRSPLDVQQPLSSSFSRDRVDGPGAGTASDFLDHLVNLRAHYHADNYYCDCADAYDWAEWRTLISPSALPSESELRLGFAGSRSSSQASFYSSTTPSARVSAPASPAVSLSAENSSSQLSPLLQSDAMGAVVTAPPAGVAVTGSSPGMKPFMNEESGAGAQGQANRQLWKVSDDQSGSPVFASIIDAEEETAPLSPVLDQLEKVHDSLCDMNDVFLYEDEETVDAEVAGAWASGDRSGGSQRGERRSSLVWSTPVAPCSGTARMLSDTGFSTTPLIYRTSTQLSLSPSASPLVARGEAEATERKERPTQRVMLAKSPSPTASSSPPSVSGASAQEEMTVPGSGWEGGATSADEVTGGVEPGQASRERSDSSDDKAADVNDAAGEACYSVMAEHDTNEATHKALLFASSDSAAPPASASASSVVSTTDSRIPSAPTRSSTSGSSCARSDSPWAPFHEVTPPSLLCRASSPGLPSPERSLPSPHLQRPRYAAVLGHADEATTSIVPCSPPPPSNRSSEHELRSRLHSLNSLATQDGSEYAHQGSPLAAVQISVEGRHAKSGEGTVGYVHDGCGSSERKSARVREKIAPDPFSLRPTAAGRIEEAQIVARRSSSVSADSSDGASSTVSAPSTTVAARPVHGRSPIFFSPEEVSRMALDITSSDATQPRSSSRGTSLRTIAEGDFVHACEDSEHTPGHQGCGDYIASYTLPGSDYWNDVDGNSEWGYRFRQSSARRSPPGGSAQSSQGMALQSASQSSQRQSAPSPVVVMPTEEAAVGTVPPHRLWQTKRRRSLSLSASALETWIRLSDEDTGSTEREAGHHMLVTQQEIPVYSRHSSSSVESGVRGRGSSAPEDSEGDFEYT